MPPCRKHVVGEEREAVKVTFKQKELLMKLMLEFPLLATGKFTRTFTNIDRKNMWMEVIERIHASGYGPTKTYEKWTKCWQDMKSKLKGKKAAIGKSRRITGGGEETTLELSQLEQRILDEFFSNTAIFGDNNVEEAGIPSDMPAYPILELRLSDGAEVIPLAVGGQEEGWVSVPMVAAVVPEPNLLVVADVPEPNDVLEVTMPGTPEAAIIEHQTSPAEAPTKSCRRRRVHATEATLDDTVSMATKFAKDQSKSTEAYTSLAESGRQIVPLLERQAAAAERQALAAERQAATTERRAAAAERRATAAEQHNQICSEKKSCYNNN